MTLPVILAALLAVIIWGASPVGSLLAVAELSPLAVATARTVLGGVLALGLALALRIPLPARRDQRLLLLISGLSGFFFFPAILTLGLKSTSGVHGSMILAFLPMTTGAIANLWDRRWPGGRWWIGCAIALCGEVLLVIAKGGAGADNASLEGDLIVFASTALASLGYVAGAKLKQTGYSSQGTTYWGVSLAALLLLPAVPFLFDRPTLENLTWTAWGALLYMAVGVTVIGYVLWYWALGKGGIARMGLFQFLQPVSGVILSALLLGEVMTLWLLPSALLILGGVFIATRKH